MEVLHYLNGSWVPTDELKVSALDITVLRGYGIFDFVRTYHHKPFRLQEHIDRLFASAKQLDFPMRWTAEEIAQIVKEGLQKNKDGYSDFGIRFIVTGGVGPNSMTLGEPNLLVIYEKAVSYPSDLYENGVKLITHRSVREFPAAKSLNYFVGIQMLRKAKDQGAIEILYRGEDGTLYECATSNFFAVKDGTLLTPKENILLGITREVVLALAHRLKIPVQETVLNYNNLPTYSEAFITASNKEVLPVVKLDDVVIGKGTVGTISKKLLFEYRKECSI